MGLFSRIRKDIAGVKERSEARRSRRVERRKQRQAARIEARHQRKSARISKRNARRMARIYKGMSPEEIAQLNQIQPQMPVMRNQLEEQGVEIENPDDTLEVAAKYAQLNDDIPNPVSDDDYNRAFVDEEDDYRSSFEYADQRGKGKVAIKAALGAITGALGAYNSYLTDKEASGAALSPAERAMLDARSEAVSTQTSQSIGDIVKQYWWVLVVVVVLIIVFRKK